MKEKELRDNHKKHSSYGEQTESFDFKKYGVKSVMKVYWKMYHAFFKSYL